MRREFRFPSQERLGVGFPDPIPSRSGVSVRLLPHSGSPARKRRTVTERGPYLIADQRSEPDHVYGPGLWPRLMAPFGNRLAYGV